MKRKGERRGGARRGSSAVLWVVGAAFALYCVFLLQLHGRAQQADGASHRVGGDAAVPTLEEPALSHRETAARALERVAQEQRAAVDQATKRLRPGVKDPVAAPVATPVAANAPAIKIDTPPPVNAAAKAPLDAPNAEKEAPKVAHGTQQPVAAMPKVHATHKPVALVVKEAARATAAPDRDQAEDAAAVVPPIPLTTAAATASALVPFRERHEVVAGYDKLMVFLENYMAPPGESLFLFFVCSDQRFRPDDWSPECVAAKQHVYSVFAASPARNRLVTVLAGSQRYWKFQNDFYNDPDLRVKGVPCLLKWEGAKGRTSGMMVHETLQYDVFLRYLFGNEDRPDPFLTPAAKAGKQVVTVNGYDAYVDLMAAIKREPSPVKTFMLMVSGRFKANNRPWCPYCRYSELPVEYAFYAFAPPRSRLVRIEVTDSYNEWKHPNRFNRDPELDMHVVPAFYKLQISPPPPAIAGDAQAAGTIVYERHKIRLDLLESLRSVFSQ